MARRNGQSEETTPVLAAMHVPSSAIMPSKEDVENSAVAMAISSVVEFNKTLAKQNQKLIETLMQSYEHMAVHVQNMHALQSDFEKQHRKNLKLQEKYLDKSEERRAAREKEKLHQDMLKQLVSDMTALAPVILNKLSGSKALTESETALLRSFVGALTDKELEGILNSLDMPKRVAFQNMLAALPDEPRGPIMREGIEPCPESSTMTEPRSSQTPSQNPEESEGDSDFENPLAE